MGEIMEDWTGNAKPGSTSSTVSRIDAETSTPVAAYLRAVGRLVVAESLNARDASQELEVQHDVFVGRSGQSG